MSGEEPMPANHSNTRCAVVGERTNSIRATRHRCIAIAALSVMASSSVRAQSPSTLVIGILPFDASRVDSTLRSLGFGIADLIATDIAMIKRLRVVERTRLGDVLREQQLAQQATFDPSRAPRLGQLLRANRLVAGSLLSSPSSQLMFEARILDAERGTVDTAVTAAANLNDILEAQKQITFRLLDRLGVVVTPREKTMIEERPTRSLAALLAYGQGVQDDVSGNFSAARKSFRRAAALDPSFRGAVNRQKQSEAAALRTEGTVVQGVVDVVNPALPNVPRQPQPSNPTTSVPVLRGSIVIPILRP